MVEGRVWMVESRIFQLVPVWQVWEPKGWVSGILMLWHWPEYLMITIGHVVPCTEIMNWSCHLQDIIEVDRAKVTRG